MKVGAEPKKIAVLGLLTAVGLYFFYTNVLSNSGDQGRRAPVPSQPSTSAPPPAAARPGRRTVTSARGNLQDFRPSLKPRKPEERLDPMKIDPTLRTDLLAKVQAVGLEGGSRNLFQFAAPPAPPAPKRPPEPPIVPKTPEQIAAEQKAAEPAKPPPPPINLKYYGYSTPRGESKKRAFFLDGEEILIAAEGDILKRRYKVVRIGVNSVVMEDTELKNQQTLPLQEEAAG